MFIIVIGVLCIMFGYMILLLTYLYPILRLVYMDWFASLFFILPFIYVLFRLKASRTYKQADRVPLWKQLILYLRRDYEVIPLTGERAFPGESFLDVENLGLIEFLGKDCVYRMGDKKIIFCLENINFSADPRYFNFTYTLFELGFSTNQDIVDVWQGNNLLLMAKVYQNMLEWDDEHGAKKLIKNILEYDGKPVDFKPEEENKKNITNIRFNPHPKKTIEHDNDEDIDSIHDKLDKLRR